MEIAGTEESPYAVEGLSFTDERLEQRRKTLGASEIPAVAGLDRYRTPLDVYLEKRGLKEPFRGNEFTEWGLRLEDVIARKYADGLGVELRTSDTLVHETDAWMSATPDRIIAPADGEPYGLEIKNKSARQAVQWGEAGTDQVPHAIAAQCHWGMMVTGLRRWDVAVLFGGNEFRSYTIPFNEQIADALRGIGKRFWFEHVVAGVEPAIDGSETSKKWLQQKFAQHSDMMLVAGRDVEGWVTRLRTVKEEIEVREQEKDELENHIKSAIGVAAGIQGRGFRVTWKAPKPTRVIDYKGLVDELRVDSATLARFTTERPNSRRFLLTFPKE